MTLALATIPDDPTGLAAWLEGHFVAGTLGDLAAELAAVHGAVPPPAGLREGVRSHLSAVLDRGLAAFPADVLRGLLRQPVYLLELQEMVLLRGGPHWDRPPAEPPLVPLEPAVEAEPKRPAGFRRLVATAAVLAAAVLVTVFVTRSLTPPTSDRGPDWGWAKAEGLPRDADAAGYLRALADRADEWFRAEPADAAALGRRLNEFRQGCTTLLLAEHPPLTPQQRQALRDRCRRWSGQIDEQVTALEAGRPPDEVRQKANELVGRIATALRQDAAGALNLGVAVRPPRPFDTAGRSGPAARPNDESKSCGVSTRGACLEPTPFFEPGVNVRQGFEVRLQFQLDTGLGFERE